MKEDSFILNQSTQLVPVSGTTVVSLKTDGKYLRRTPHEHVTRESDRVVARTDNGRMSMTPAGLRVKMYIAFDLENATMENFIGEAARLYTNWQTDELANQNS